MSYTRGTFAALVDALIPETPELAARGDEQVPGGLEVGLEEAVIERVNNFVETHGLASLAGDAVPLAPVVAALLDTAAAELLVRRRDEDGLQSPDSAFSSGPFSRLSREDRLRALRLLEEEGVVAALAERFDAASLGTVQFLASSLPILVEFVYYSEATAEEGEERSLGWRQADYPGPADGYPVMMGYEVAEFEENEY
ncbi:hypothetical protein [Natronomonas marina]|uniref:hypothetical protein n=1 Tax=Natronomonas marina TaxID=2961939 RepID=UPI0020C9B270|nr:hypothetical protein [Natronomonas marina]